jgi:hypothetical protein
VFRETYIELASRMDENAKREIVEVFEKRFNKKIE